ncbi:MAG: lytic transglycosylase domain-containing protein [Acidobacteria bacterium]|nr:lytic transglycosylase domain-containing protein [Acidobacteriota bacterium]
MTLPRDRIRSIRPADSGTPPGPGVPAPAAADPVGIAAPVPGGLGFPRPEGPAGGDLFSQIADLALKYGLDTRLVAAVALVESGLDPAAVSPKGAMGLMQLMPATATVYGVVNPFDPRENLEAGISHLKDLLNRFGGDLELALAGYNAGEAAVRRFGGIPPYAETIRYVDRVLALLRARI